MMDNDKEQKKMDEIIVEVDAELESIIPFFLEGRKNDVGALEKALSGKDFESIRILGHNMKGAGGGYGFNSITDIGAALETAAVNKDEAAIQKNVEKLSDYLRRVKIVFA